MEQTSINLQIEQQASLSRPPYKYSLLARLFFAAMDLVTGKQLTLAKVKLVEILASVPYREWENRQYTRMTQHYQNQTLVQHARRIVTWGREAQDNEYMHLLVINEKKKEDGVTEPWYLSPPLRFLIVLSYVVFARTMALFNINRAFLFNAEFEDHAEHSYAQFVSEHPEWEEQPVTNALVKEYGALESWAGVFRRIGLDERDHMNASFAFCGKPDNVIPYDGMPMTH